MPPALKWPQRRATIGRAALCVRAALGVWLGGGHAAAPAASLGGLVRAFARPPAFLALARCALCSLAVCAFAQGAPARRACVLPPVAAVVRGLRVGRARAVAFCSGVFLRWRRGGGLALASCPPPRRAVVRLPVLFRARGAPPGAVAGGCSGVWSGVSSAGAFLAAASAVFFSPLTTPLFSPWRWRAAMRSISVRGAKNSCAPVRPLAGRLSCGRGPRLGCVRGRRAWAVVLPPLACALRLPRRVLLPRPSARVAPVVWLAGRGGEGCCILQRPRMGDEHAPSGAQIAAHRRRFSPCFAHKILCTKNPRPEKYWQGTAGNGSRPQNRGKAQKSPEMPSNCARPDQRRAKRDSQSQTASRLAGNGLSNVVALSVRPVGV